ncbi:unnamed protein product [Schistosoma bovis]|nr:unnamed protein product [Schistosoma bovis]
MFHYNCIVLTLLTVFLWQSNGINAKSSLNIDANEIECDICMGVVSLGKLFLVSPIMDSIKKMLIEKLCSLPGIMTRRVSSMYSLGISSSRRNSLSFHKTTFIKTMQVSFDVFKEYFSNINGLNAKG